MFVQAGAYASAAAPAFNFAIRDQGQKKPLDIGIDSSLYNFLSDCGE